MSENLKAKFRLLVGNLRPDRPMALPAEVSLSDIRNEQRNVAAIYGLPSTSVRPLRIDPLIIEESAFLPATANLPVRFDDMAPCDGGVLRLFTHALIDLAEHNLRHHGRTGTTRNECHRLLSLCCGSPGSNSPAKASRSMIEAVDLALMTRGYDPMDDTLGEEEGNDGA